MERLFVPAASHGSCQGGGHGELRRACYPCVCFLSAARPLYSAASCCCCPPSLLYTRLYTTLCLPLPSSLPEYCPIPRALSLSETRTHFFLIHAPHPFRVSLPAFFHPPLFILVLSGPSVYPFPLFSWVSSRLPPVTFCDICRTGSLSQATYPSTPVHNR